MVVGAPELWDMEDLVRTFNAVFGDVLVLVIQSPVFEPLKGFIVSTVVGIRIAHLIS